MRHLILTLVPAVLLASLAGCGGSGEATKASAQADGEKVRDVSKDLVTKIGYPSSKGMQKTPPKRR